MGTWRDVLLAPLSADHFNEDFAVGDTVLLHVYDLNEPCSYMNKVALDALGFGGALHVGVEVLGQEWSFGLGGVSTCMPKRNPYHLYRQTAVLGKTPLRRIDVQVLTAAMKREWRSMPYDLLVRNCSTFCRELVRRLGVGPLPAWIDALPQALDQLPGMRQLAQALAKVSMTRDDFDRFSTVMGSAPAPNNSAVASPQGLPPRTASICIPADAENAVRALNQRLDQGQPSLQDRLAAFNLALTPERPKKPQPPSLPGRLPRGSAGAAAPVNRVLRSRTRFHMDETFGAASCSLTSVKHEAVQARVRAPMRN